MTTAAPSRARTALRTLSTVLIVSGGLEAARFEGSLVASTVLAAIDEVTP